MAEHAPQGGGRHRARHRAGAGTDRPQAGGPSAGIDRRKFLLGAAGAAGLVAVGAGVAAASGGGSPAPSRLPARARRPVEAPAVSLTTLPSGNQVPVARWVVEENARPGSLGWVVTGVQSPHVLEGYASQVSAVPGDDVHLFVNTSARTVQVQAYRMGYYQGLAGRLVWQSDTVAGAQQGPPEVAAGTNTVACRWEPTFTVKVDKTWPPGCYLLKLVGDAGQQQYITLTVRDDASQAAYVIQNSVTTWQAYNLWGEYSLYYGATASGGSDFANRARVVSFDRPYPQTWAQGAADFFGNEFPLLYHAEQLGLDVTYWTDVDLHARPALLANHQALFSLGHDEYWSTPMRNGAAAALRSGTNLAFLGANACYRQIRMEDSPVGPNRLEVCYKDAAEDPLSAEQPELTTVNWIQSPLNNPESTLIGSMYQSVRADDPLVITDSSSWLWRGCGFEDGTALPHVVQGEYDRYTPSLPGPRNLDVLAHSPVAGQGNWSDVTYYSVEGGGGVLATGMASFVFKLSNTTAFPWNIVPKALPGITAPLLVAVENVLGAFGQGGAGTTTPSGSNWTTVYQGAAAEAGPAQGTNAA
jgi:hypothetical protein